ncbi:tRNA (guanine(10)-N2)-methyltransferase [Penicillium canariense]|uniref:tRNA (guanine(10)-N(2))-methyltransferase n=1 Tax=Penicillium canariense TaxID=189055 RepID=A0A9W9I7J8_9EURO|nr:tRNA (guanine(10)-N2)-methyltransferase [Penicillium canariense]KAJ5168273.1 tRNA (guanine(10)-N2)-methyltransferase [Penicillium canariense]
MEYLVVLAQCHETFRQAELQALATLHGIDLEIIAYNEWTPHCIVRLKDDTAARALISRSILAKDILELWGQGATYEELHADVHRRTQHRWADYRHVAYSLSVDCFSGKRSTAKKREIFESFTYLQLKGPVRLKNPDEQFRVAEEYVTDVEACAIKTKKSSEPRRIYLGRWIAKGSRDVVDTHNLKKRKYISTTSMDAELSLVTANMALAAPGKVFYDPFVGAGSFLVAASHFGALTMGSDIDPRAFRGKEHERQNGIAMMQNFQQYNLTSKFLDAFTSDLTNTPLRETAFLDGIICDPPYGVREGLRVLGTRDGNPIPPVIIDGVLAHYREGFIPPKRPYGFEALQRDVLDFAVRTLVPHGRLAMWMPTASDEAVEFPVPMHPNLEVVSVCVQPFSNWSRRLMIYRRLPEGQTSDVTLGRIKADGEGVSADDLNAFRVKYNTRNILRAEQEKATQNKGDTPEHE